MHASRRHALLVAVNLGSFVATLDISIVNVALPAMQAALRTDMAGLQWVVDAYALCLSAFILSAGPLGTAMGASVPGWPACCCSSPARPCAAGRRPTHAAGGARRAGRGRRAVDTGRAVAADAGLPGSARAAQAIGIWASSNATALIAGPVLGGVLVAHFSWQSIFLINLPLGALAVALGMWSIRESAHPEHAAFDPLGQALSVVWLGALAYGLIAAGEHGWDSRPAGLALALAAAGLAAFVTVELRARRPVLPLGLFRDRGYAVTNFASFVLGFSGYSSLFFFSLYLQQVQGLSPLAAGSQLAPQFIASGIASTVFGKLNPRFGLPRLMIAGYALIGAAMLGMTGLDAHTPYALTCALMVLLGVGSGWRCPPPAWP